MSLDDTAPLPAVEGVDEESIYRFVFGVLGHPYVKVEADRKAQLEEFLKDGLELYSRYRPTLRYFSLECFAGVQHYVPRRDTVGFSVVDVMIPRIDPIAPLLLSSGSKIDIFGYRYCFAGDTSISLLDGRERTIEQIIEEFGDGQFWVYSVDKDGQVRPGYAHSARKTGVQEKVVRVTLDNGKSVVVTPAHKFVMRDGSEKPAGSLQPGDSLMPLYRRVTNGERVLSGYEKVHAGESGVEEYTHRLVAAEFRFGQCELCGEDVAKPEHGVRHHRNFNKRDNRPDNLQWVTHKEHHELHRPFEEMWKDPEYRARMVELITRRHQEDGEFQAARDGAASATMKRLWSDLSFREKKSRQQSEMMATKWQLEEWRNTTGQIVLAALDEARRDPAFIAWNSLRLAQHNQQRWANDPIYRERMTREASAHMTRLWQDPDFRLRVSIASSARMAKLWEDPEFRERHRDRLIAQWKDPAYREQQTEAISEAALGSWQDDTVRSRREAGMKEAWSGEHGAKKRKVASENASKRWADPEFKQLAAEKMILGRARKAHGRDGHAGDFESCGPCQTKVTQKIDAKRAGVKYNHKVVSVEDAGFADVFDLAVEDHHNFALTCGVFVKNSFPYRDISELYIDYFYYSEAKKILSADFKWKWIGGGIAIHPRPDEPFPLTYCSAFPHDLRSFPREDLPWLKKYVLALTEQAVGNARGKFPIVGGAQAMQQTDGVAMVERGLMRQQEAEAQAENLGYRFPIMR